MAPSASLGSTQTKFLNLVPFRFDSITFLFFRLITMYFIMPDTEQRSLEDIELHYSDNTKGITDIYIHKKSEIVP